MRAETMFLELLRNPEVGMRRLRFEYCPRCETDRPHWFLCVSVAPRVWKYRCVSCNPELPQLEEHDCDVHSAGTAEGKAAAEVQPEDEARSHASCDSAVRADRSEHGQLTLGSRVA